MEIHQHNGIDAPKLDPRDLKGFPVIKSEAKFTFKPLEGFTAYRWKTSDNTYYHAVYINSTWVEIAMI